MIWFLAITTYCVGLVAVGGVYADKYDDSVDGCLIGLMWPLLVPLAVISGAQGYVRNCLRTRRIRKQLHGRQESP